MAIFNAGCISFLTNTTHQAGQTWVILACRAIFNAGWVQDSRTVTLYWHARKMVNAAALARLNARIAAGVPGNTLHGEGFPVIIVDRANGSTVRLGRLELSADAVRDQAAFEAAWNSTVMRNEQPETVLGHMKRFLYSMSICTESAWDALIAFFAEPFMDAYSAAITQYGSMQNAPQRTLDDIRNTAKVSYYKADQRLGTVRIETTMRDLAYRAGIVSTNLETKFNNPPIGTSQENLLELALQIADAIGIKERASELNLFYKKVNALDGEKGIVSILFNTQVASKQGMQSLVHSSPRVVTEVRKHMAYDASRLHMWPAVVTPRNWG
eukprot:2530668-Rhodomonas_salina.2